MHPSHACPPYRLCFFSVRGAQHAHSAVFGRGSLSQSIVAAGLGVAHMLSQIDWGYGLSVAVEWVQYPPYYHESGFGALLHMCALH
jgi:hypothetical protein